ANGNERRARTALPAVPRPATEKELILPLEPPMPTRRDFLAASAAAIGAPALNALGANDRLNIGLIGTGNRGRTIATEAIKNGCKLVAVADCAKFRFAALKPVLDKLGYAGKPETHDDYRELL